MPTPSATGAARAPRARTFPPLSSTLSPNSVAVIGTSDDAAVSKASACALGYFDDPFLQYFISHPSRRPPLINRGYFSRVAAIMKVVSEFVRLPGPRQVVSLGAGADTIFFKLKTAGIAPAQYYELDFTEAIQRKAATIHQQPALSALAGACEQRHEGIFNYPQLTLVGVDLRDIDSLDRQMSLAGVDYSLPTLFLSECVLIYMSASESRPVIEWTARKFTGGSIIVNYEQIHPNDAFGRTMINNLNQRGCSLLGFESYPDLAAQRRRYLDAGYTVYQGWDMNEIYRYYLPQDEVRRIERLELFDEYEEWNMIQAHYHISMAANASQLENIGILNKIRTNQSHTQAHPHSESAPRSMVASPVSSPSCPSTPMAHLYPPVDVHQP